MFILKNNNCFKDYRESKIFHRGTNLFQGWSTNCLSLWKPIERVILQGGGRSRCPIPLLDPHKESHQELSHS